MLKAQKVIKLLSVISFLILNNSCHEKDKSIITYESFLEEISISGDRTGPVNFYKDPCDLSLKDSLIILTDNKGKFCFSFLRVSNFALVDTFGRKGKGPGEFLLPELSQKIIKRNPLITLKEKYYSSFYKLDSMLKNEMYIPKDRIIFPTHLVIPYNIIELNDSIILGHVSSGACRMFLYNTRTFEYKLLKMNPKFKGDNKASLTDLGQITYATTDYNEMHEKIVSAIRFFDQIDIIDIHTFNIVKSIMNTKSTDARYEYTGEVMSDKTYFYYIDIQATDRYIYGLYCGKDLASATPNVGNEIHIFNWEGIPVLKMNLNIGLSNILILDDNEIIGIDPFADQPIVAYHIDQL